MDTPALRFRALRRPRILDRIASSIYGLAPLTLVCAPAGFGKTTAVVHWAEEMIRSGDADIHWVRSPDPGIERDLLWSGIRLAFGKGDRSARKPSATQAREEVEQILSRLTRPTVLVIDDYQGATTGELDLALARLLERSDLLHLVVLSRRFIALDGPLVSSRVSVSVIAEKDLALTEEEGHELAMLYGVTDFEGAEQMRQQIHGWPIVVRSVLQAFGDGRSRRDVSLTLARFGRQHLEETTTVGGRRAVLAVVLCPDISTETVADLIEHDFEDTELLMRELGELGLVQQSWWFDTKRYRCHEGLADSLEALALQEFGQDAHAIRLRHAVDLSRDDPAGAVKQLLDLKEYGCASRLFIQHMMEFALPELGMLQRLRRIPNDVLREHPFLIGALLLMETSEPDTPQERIEQLYRWLRSGMRRRLLQSNQEPSAAPIALLAVAERMRGDGAEALRLAKDIESRVASSPESRSMGFRYSMPLLYSALGFVGTVVGDVPLAERSYLSSIEAAERFGNPAEQLRGLNGLAMTSSLTGDMVSTERHLLRGDLIRDRVRDSGPQLTWVNEKLARAQLAYERQEVDVALELISSLYEARERIEQWPLLLIAEARVRRLADGAYVALELLERRQAEARGGFPATPYLRCMVGTHAARLHAALGNYAGAEKGLASLPDTHPDVALAKSALGLFSGDAAVALARAEEAARRNLTSRQRVEHALLTAVASWEVGRGEEAFACLSEADERMRALGLRLVAGSVPYSMLETLVRAAQEAGAGTFVEGLEALPPTLRADVFEPLSKAELRVLEALVTGESLQGIASAVFVTENTVKFHLKRIYRKLRVSSRSEAVERARYMRLAHPYGSSPDTAE